MTRAVCETGTSHPVSHTAPTDTLTDLKHAVLETIFRRGGER